MPSQRCQLQRSLQRRYALSLLLLAACPYLLAATTAPEQSVTPELFPVNRPVNNIREAALQSVGRDGPRYPDDGFLATVHKYMAAYPSDVGGPTDHAATPGDGSAASGQSPQEHCAGGFAVLTMGNYVVMETLMPLLLESLHRIELPPAPQPGGAADAVAGDTRHDNLGRHTLVVGINTEALQACIRLRRRYRNGCLTDGISGMHEGDYAYPDFRFLSYGMAKLKYIVNALGTGASILWLDADVVLLRNPFPDLLAAGGADIAVATAPAPCGSQPQKPDWAFIEDAEDDDDAAGGTGGTGDAGAASHGSADGRRELLQDGGGGAAASGGYAPGITFYRSTPGAMRCAYSLLLDMLNVALRNSSAVVLEQEHFASFMPTCAEALGLQLRELPRGQYLTAACGGADAAAAAAEAARGGGGGVVAVHVSGGVLGTPQRERLALMQDLLGVTLGDMAKRHAAAEEGEGGGGGGGTDSAQATAVAATESVQV